MRAEVTTRQNHRGQYICEACGDGISAYRCEGNIHRCRMCFGKYEKERRVKEVE